MKNKQNTSVVKEKEMESLSMDLKISQVNSTYHSNANYGEKMFKIRMKIAVSESGHYNRLSYNFS